METRVQAALMRRHLRLLQRSLVSRLRMFPRYRLWLGSSRRQRRAMLGSRRRR